MLITSEELAEQGKLTADLAVVTNAFADKYPDAVQTWVEQQNRAVHAVQVRPAGRRGAVGRQLNITADEALAQMKELIFLDAAEQAGADYLGTPGRPGRSAENLRAPRSSSSRRARSRASGRSSDYQAGLANQFVGQGRRACERCGRIALE